MNEDYWYYEEHYNGMWIDCCTGCRFNRDAAVGRMEVRKKQRPRAKLRLVHVTRERFSYRNRHNAT